MSRAGAATGAAAPTTAAEAAALVAAVPLAEFFGLRVEPGGERFVVALPFDARLVGNITQRRLHGGAIGGFLECAATLFLRWHCGPRTQPRTISVGIDYLRPGALQDVFATVHPVKLGSRVARLRLEAWQTAADRPIAVAHANIELAPIGPGAR